MRIERGVLLIGMVLALIDCGGGGFRMPPPPAVVAAVCGNGQAELGEECDDGNGNNADGCLTTCQKPVTWIPSDPHIHSSGCDIDTDAETVERLLRSQDIQVGATLVWGDRFSRDAHYFTGRDHPTAPGFLQHYDLEVSHFAAELGGHLLLLGLDSLQFSDDIFKTPKSNVPVIAWAKKQPRAVVGLAHGEFWPQQGFPRPPVVCCMPWEYAAHVARGQLDFLSSERRRDKGPIDAATFTLWKAAQSSGFRVAIAGASDWPCIAREFNDQVRRTHVMVEGPLTYESWLLAIKAGRTATAVGYGERLNVRVNGERIGSEVHLAAPGEVTVTLETTQATPTDVEVLVNGVTHTTVRTEAGAAVTELKLNVAASSWISARNPFVLTSPVFALVGGRPIRASADDTCFLLQALDHVDDLVFRGQLDMAESRDEALAAYAEARRELAKRFQEAGGQTCP